MAEEIENSNDGTMSGLKKNNYWCDNNRSNGIRNLGYNSIDRWG